MIYTNELDVFVRKLKNNEVCMDFFNQYIAQNMFTQRDFTLKLIQKAKKIAAEFNSERAKGWCLLYEGWYYHNIGKYSDAITYHTDANDIFKHLDDKLGLTRAANALLGDYIRLGMFDLAIESGLEGIKIAEKEQDTETLNLLLINTASAYLEATYYKECIEILSRIKKESHQLKEINYIIFITILAEAHLRLNEVEKTLNYCNKAHELVENTGYYALKPDVLYLRAQANYKLGNFELVEQDIENAVRMASIDGNVDTLIKALVSWAKFETDQQNYDSAEIMLLNAIEESKKISSPLLLKDIYFELSELYNKMNKFEQAYRTLKNSLEFEKEVFNQNSGIWFAKLHSAQITQEATAYKVLYDQVYLMSKIGKRITSNLEREATLETIYKEVNQLVEADVFGIALYQEAEDCLDYELFIINGEQVVGGKQPVKDNQTFGAYCYNNKTEIFMSDITKEYNKYLNFEIEFVDDNKGKPNSVIICPLMIEERVIGIITIQNLKKHAYTAHDLNTLRMLTSYIAIALENTKLFHDLEYLATHDSLSDTLTRREVLKQGQLCFEQNKSLDNPISIIMLDIDHFKQINDQYGHFVGDDVIKEVSNIIKNNVRYSDYVGRYGGEEFLIVLPETDLIGARAVGERIRECVGKYIHPDVLQMRVTVSSGVYQLSEKEITFFEGVKLADIALYKAKQLGRNRVVNYLSWEKDEEAQSSAS